MSNNKETTVTKDDSQKKAPTTEERFNGAVPLKRPRKGLINRESSNNWEDEEEEEEEDEKLEKNPITIKTPEYGGKYPSDYNVPRIPTPDYGDNEPESEMDRTLSFDQGNANKKKSVIGNIALELEELEKEKEKVDKKKKEVKKIALELEEKRINFQEKVNEFIREKGNFVSFNVGGRIFTTRMETIAKGDEGNLLSTIVLNDQSEKINGGFFLDRSSKGFESIIDWLRDGEITKHMILDDMVLREADYYGFPSLRKGIEKKKEDRKRKRIAPGKEKNEGIEMPKKKKKKKGGPRNAYQIFMKDAWSKLRESKDYEKKNFSENSKKMGAMWKGIDDETRNIYAKKAKVEKEKFKCENKK